MKFGQDFQSALKHEEYPKEWIDSAISYKKLKKCIKRVQQELLSLGLDQDTLNALWQHVGSVSDDAALENSDRLLQYSLEGSGGTRFTPILTIAIDPKDGSPMDAWLSPQTRHQLSKLARSPRSSGTSIAPMIHDGDSIGHFAHSVRRNLSISDDQSIGAASATEHEDFETVEIPLTSDSEFFQILRRELKDLENLQDDERVQLQAEIEKLGANLRRVKASKSKRSKEEIEAWRKIFELYTDAEVFFSSHEQDAGIRDGSHAQRQYQSFRNSLAVQQQNNVLQLGKEANTALDRFLHVNVKLLRLIKFQEINRTALTKIMKKFNKQTALHGQDTVTKSLRQAPFMTQDLAKATCFTISEELLQIIPQLNDYLCPVCFSITYKPVRLRCNHVFCIRCLIVMQRQEEDHCPLCRSEVVLEATEEHLDQKLGTFLKANFKQEVKEKQKANEVAAGIDRWGAAYDKSQKCIVM